MLELNIIDVICTKEELIDSNWLFSNIPWSNHDNAKAKITFNSPIEMFAIILDGFDTQSAQLKKFKFDSVDVMAVHGFGGNSYMFDFFSGDEKVHSTSDEYSIAYNEEDVKRIYSDKIKRKIKGLNWQIEYAKKALDNLQVLTLNKNE